MTTKDTTILIQGPINQVSLNNIRRYKRWGEILVSCWKGDILDLPENEAIRLVTTDANAKLLTNRYNYANIFKQALSTYNGLKQVDTEFVIKVRSDEYYTDLLSIVNQMKANPECLVTNNVFFRRDSFLKFHPSDHVMACKTELLLKTFRVLIATLSSVKGSNHQLPGRNFGYPQLRNGLVPEQLIALSFLKAKGVTPDSGRSREQMREHVRLVRVSEMGAFTVRANAFNTSFSNEKEMIECYGIASITSMDEL